MSRVATATGLAWGLETVACKKAEAEKVPCSFPDFPLAFSHQHFELNTQMKQFHVV